MIYPVVLLSVLQLQALPRVCGALCAPSAVVRLWSAPVVRLFACGDQLLAVVACGLLSLLLCCRVSMSHVSKVFMLERGRRMNMCPPV